jgi:hypothetical protein
MVQRKMPKYPAAALVAVVALCYGGAAIAQTTMPGAPPPNQPSPTTGPAAVPPPIMVATAASPPAHAHVAVVPDHFAVGNQYYEASVSGLRNLVESIRIVQPDLYAELDPKVSALEARRNAAIGVLVAGIAAGGVSIIYGFAARKTCNEPRVGDPAFAEKSQAWGDCNQENMAKSATFSLIGLGSIAVGVFGSFAITPGRSALMQVVNEHNRLSPQPIRWELGFGPSNRMARGALSFAF